MPNRKLVLMPNPKLVQKSKTGKRTIVRTIVDLGAAMGEPSLSIREFCKLENFSKAHYYNLKKRGLAPEEIQVLNLVRITPAARQEWHEKIKRYTESRAGKLQKKRFIEFRKQASLAWQKTNAAKKTKAKAEAAAAVAAE
jgi:hypothetical protein